MQYLHIYNYIQHYSFYNYYFSIFLSKIFKLNQWEYPSINFNSLLARIFFHHYQANFEWVSFLGSGLGRGESKPIAANEYLFQLFFPDFRLQSSTVQRPFDPQNSQNITPLIPHSFISDPNFLVPCRFQGSENGVGRARGEHIPCSPADEQCDRNRREGPQRVPERDYAGSSSVRCAIQARTRHADQHQEDRKPRRPRRRSQQTQDHPAST